MGILVHQSDYVKKVLEKFNIDKVYPQRSPMVARALEKVKIHLGRNKREKRFWELNTHTSVPLVPFCTLQTMQDSTLCLW
jgi:hypothetical protein